jgi:hypothetical protein
MAAHRSLRVSLKVRRRTVHDAVARTRSPDCLRKADEVFRRPGAALCLNLAKVVSISRSDQRRRSDLNTCRPSVGLLVLRKSLVDP